MEIKVKDENLSVIFNKKTFYFCCDHCKIQFLQNPGKYAGNLSPDESGQALWEKKENDDENKHQH